jgi:hypothetical protein
MPSQARDGHRWNSIEVHMGHSGSRGRMREILEKLLRYFFKSIHSLSA